MSTIIVNIEDGIAFVGLNRPEKANAYTQSMLMELSQLLDMLHSNDQVQALIVHGCDSKNFCAGSDLQELESRRPQDGLKLYARIVFDQLAKYPTPVIAAIRGAALGGGLELALAADIRIGSTDSIYGFPETSRGLIPAAGGCFRAPRILGTTLAKEMILFNRRLNGQEALQYGLISQLTEPELVLDTAKEWAQRALANNHLANQLAKQAINISIPEGAYLAFEGAAQATLYGEFAHKRETDSLRSKFNSNE